MTTDMTGKTRRIKVDELIKKYEADIKAIEIRINELRAKTVCSSDDAEKRIELLCTERLELMHSTARMRNITAQKPPSPVYINKFTAAEGDAAC